MAEVVTVTRFKCGRCGNLKEVEADADNHCICKCGRPVIPYDRHMGHFDECALCHARGAVVRSKARVRKLEVELEGVRAHLAKLEEQFEAEKAASAPVRKLRAVSG
jgi:hypothetical protein